MLKFIKDNNSLFEQSMICVGIKSCGAMPGKYLTPFPKLRKHIIGCNDDSTLRVGESFVWEESDKIILVCITSSARLRETAPSNLIHFLGELTNISNSLGVDNIAMVNLVNDMHSEYKNILQRFFLSTKKEFTYYV